MPDSQTSTGAVERDRARAAGASRTSSRFHRTAARRSKEIEQDAQGEQVAARIVADAEQLLGRHVGRRAEGQPELLLHQVGKLIVMREAEVEENGFAVRPEHDVARLDVEMDDMLPMQIVQSRGDFHADVGDLRIGQREIRQPRQQRLAGDPFHHDVGLHGKIAGGNEFWNVRAGQARQDHLLHFETDDGGWILAFADSRHLHQHRHRRVGARDAPERRHAAPVHDVLRAGSRRRSSPARATA